jgi:hypothetical protein
VAERKCLDPLGGGEGFSDARCLYVDLASRRLGGGNFFACVLIGRASSLGKCFSWGEFQADNWSSVVFTCNLADILARESDPLNCFDM